MYMSSYRRRLETFIDWKNKGQVTPENLALSGFYKRPVSDDSVVCYMCNITLRNWQATDVPNTEHKRFLYSRFCSHLESVADVQPRSYDEVDTSGETSSRWAVAQTRVSG